MVVTRIKASNFKSFKDIDIRLNKFNMLVGANASGKTNFIQIFKFLRDLTNHGLENAVSMQGGVEYLRSINIGASENLDISFEYIFEKNIKVKNIWIHIKSCEYNLSIKFTKKGCFIQQEFIKLNCERWSNDKNILGRGYIELIPDSKKIKINSDIKDSNDNDIPIADYPPFNILNSIYSPDTFLRVTLFILGSVDFLNNISFYDIDPKLPKKAAPISGKIDLEEDGSNIALVMKHLFGDKEKKRKFSNLINDILPFVEDVGVEKFADQSLLFTLKENYFKKEFMPASLVSDGTINIAALIVALYFSKNGFTVIEEPERNMHPKLMSKLMSFMKDASENKQILITTHNPELVKYADINDLLLVSRGKDGYSNVTCPSEIEDLHHFLENDIGLGEIHTDDLWGV